MAKNKAPTKGKSQKCGGCGVEFPSRNAVFKHLRETDGACLSGEDLLEFRQYVRDTDKGIKVVILYGYLPIQGRIRNGDDAARILLKAIQQLQVQFDGPLPAAREKSASEKEEEAIKYSRSYGHSQRGVEIVAQDNGTGAVTEVITTRLPEIRGGRTVDQWLDQVQDILNSQFDQESPVPIRILGRQEIPQAKRFNAEMNLSHRRVEYLLPIEFISWAVPALKERLETLPTFSENHKHNLHHSHVVSGNQHPDDETRIFLFKLKKMMQKLSTQITDLDMNDKGAVMEKGFNVQKRKANAKKSSRKKKAKPEKSEDETATTLESKGKRDDSLPPCDMDQQRVLKRKRFHNFTAKLMAHEYLAYRRLDRLYHRATLSYPSIDNQNKPFMLLSMRGDLFLTGQVCRVIGVFLAMANGLIDTDIVDCLFDEDYPHLIPTPSAPLTGMIAGESSYMTWEGKLKAILTPRSTDRYPKGWNQVSTLERVKEWQDIVHEEIARQWFLKGRDESSGRLVAEMEWTEGVLMPWLEKAQQHLEDYRTWRQNRNSEVEGSTALSSLADGVATVTKPPILAPPIESIDPSIPELYEKVLYHLRKVDKSGQWPSTTPKRQLVMISTEEGKEQQPSNLQLARLKAINNKGDRSSAYSFAEGQGGASGSFSVGLMPGGGNKQPKNNFLFPELVQAAFELERKLCPEREPSSTIAINRNAQFRPHTDSGAGAGQSTSLIVGLGTYSGGELMVEGEKKDIRYKAIEFNGWKQRHWTMPFVGERYSLVWFTPKGCEGMRGVDLDLSDAIKLTQSSSLI